MKHTGKQRELLRFQNIDMLLEQLEMATKHLAVQIQSGRSPDDRLLANMNANGFKALAQPEDTIEKVQLKFEQRKIELLDGLTDEADIKTMQGVLDSVQLILDHTPSNRDLTVRQEKILGYLILGAMNMHTDLAREGITALLHYSPKSLDSELNRIGHAITHPADLLRPEFYDPQHMKHGQGRILKKLKHTTHVLAESVVADYMLTVSLPSLPSSVFSALLEDHRPEPSESIQANISEMLGAAATVFSTRFKRKDKADTLHEDAPANEKHGKHAARVGKCADRQDALEHK